MVFCGREYVELIKCSKRHGRALSVNMIVHHGPFGGIVTVILSEKLVRHIKKINLVSVALHAVACFIFYREPAAKVMGPNVCVGIFQGGDSQSNVY